MKKKTAILCALVMLLAMCWTGSAMAADDAGIMPVSLTGGCKVPASLSALGISSDIFADCPHLEDVTYDGKTCTFTISGGIPGSNSTIIYDFNEIRGWRFTESLSDLYQEGNTYTLTYDIPDEWKDEYGGGNLTLKSFCIGSDMEIDGATFGIYNEYWAKSASTTKYIITPNYVSNDLEKPGVHYEITEGRDHYFANAWLTDDVSESYFPSQSTDYQLEYDQNGNLLSFYQEIDVPNTMYVPYYYIYYRSDGSIDRAEYLDGDGYFYRWKDNQWYHNDIPVEQPEDILNPTEYTMPEIVTSLEYAAPTPPPASTDMATPIPTDTPTPEPTATPVPTDTPTPEPTATPEITATPESSTTPEPSTATPTYDESIGKLIIPDDPTFAGFATFEGGQFYFTDGQQRTDYVGPVQIDGTFYAFAQGRLQTENLMMAFEGGLFAFNGGKLRTDLTGLAAYDGEQFVFDHGQYQHDACGPYLDPISGRWVYVNYGQYYPITDLVSYDGEVFYFVNGELASGFTGIVRDFNGTGLYIGNGQHYKVTDLINNNGQICYVIDGVFAENFTGTVTDFTGTPFNIVNGVAQ